jgi:hypothetical protein
MFNRAVGALAAILALAAVTVVAWGDDTPVAESAPRGMIAFFTGGACPPGWVPAEEVEGRLVIPVTAPSDVAVTVGSALADREDRTHVHAFTATAKLSSKDVVAFDGSNDDGAAAQTYPVAGATSAQTSGLPFVQVQACARP